MHVEFHLLQDIVVIFALASFVIWLFHRLRIPSIIGFLLTGVLTGPHAFGLVQSIEEIELLAEIGVVLLLFTIGIEFSLKSLMKSRKLVFMAGFLQVVLTGAITYAIALLSGASHGESIFFGFLVALSSTAVVLKMLQERAEINTEYGRFSTGVLIFQDIAIVPMILVIPLLAGNSTNMIQDIGFLVIKVAGILVLTYLGARFFVPWMLHQVARTKSQELFLLAVLMFGLAVAWLTASLGMSLALGAFLAGLIISESDYSHQAFGNVIPLRDLFISFFFVSIGMLFNFDFILKNPLLILASTFIVLFVKTFISGLVAFFLGFPFRSTVLAGLALSQVGEFSFVIARIGINNELINNDFYQVFISVSVLTMSAAPFIMILAPRISELMEKLPMPNRLRNGLNPPSFESPPQIINHLIIIGHGLHGHNVAKAARTTGIEYIILDNDPDIVAAEREKGERIYFGDASHEAVLRQAYIENAEVVVITPSNAAAAYNITEKCRKLNPKAHIIVRSRQMSAVGDLYQMGANEVIPEEFETSVEIFSRVLNKYLVPRDEIQKQIAELRSDGYTMFRDLDVESASMRDLRIKFPDLEVSALKIPKNSGVGGKKILDIRLRAEFGITIVAIRKEEENILNPDPGTVLEPGDIIYVIGSPFQIACATRLFENSEDPECPPDEN